MKIIRSILYLSILAFVFQSCGDRRSADEASPDEMIRMIKESASKKDTAKAATARRKPAPVITNIVDVHTNFGTIKLGLYGKDAPKTVKNFLALIRNGYYNGIKFHRVAKDFLIQAGDRNTIFKNKRSEWGLGGESIYGKPFADELDSTMPAYKLGYQPGTIAMANKGPNTNTSQFFICLEDAENLQHHYTIFGRVLDGMNVVEDISSVKTESSDRGEYDGIPKKDVIIRKITIIEPYIIKAAPEAPREETKDSSKQIQE